MRDLVEALQSANLPICQSPNSSRGPPDQRSPAFGQDAGANKEIRAYRINGESPSIDGRFDEELWTAAQAIDDFTQQEPDNMAAPRERTVVQVAYDDRFLYVAVRCYARDAATISAGLGRRGSIPASDKIGIGLDPRHDHLTGYYFIANPSGVQSDSSLLQRHARRQRLRGGVGSRDERSPAKDGTPNSAFRSHRSDLTSPTASRVSGGFR